VKYSVLFGLFNFGLGLGLLNIVYIRSFELSSYSCPSRVQLSRYN